MKVFIVIIATLFIMSGCGQKPIVVKGKINRPISSVPTKRTKPILGQQIPSTNPLENPSVILGSEINGTIEGNQTLSPQRREIILGGSEEMPGDEPVMDPTISQSYVATLKTKKFAYSDAAFMQEENGVIDLQILSAGKPLVTLKISSDVCVNHNCISKEEFNQDYLSSAYPAELINNVLTKQPIMGGRNLRRITGGFMQKINTPEYSIRYKTTPGSIYFKDMKNKIVIKLRRLK
ncbi:MAG: hypothetical protein DSZ06_02265 [Sulfurospirillum sp.]|nr:MAG: hypothetical protein DSZ06_02265 [Sulfurospirillum sp.]